MSSTRVMATCAVLGQAAGTAAALCAHHSKTPRQLHAHHLDDLQRRLMDDDCWLPGKLRLPESLWFEARLSAEGEHVEALLDGWERDRPDVSHAWTCEPGGSVTFQWNREREIPGLRLVLDSNLCSDKRMPCTYPQSANTHALPGELVRDLDIQTKGLNGDWETIRHIRDNRKRLLEIPLSLQAESLRIRLLRGWSEHRDLRLFSVDLLHKERDDTFTPPAGQSWKNVVARTDPEELLPPENQTPSGHGGGHRA